MKNKKSALIAGVLCYILGAGIASPASAEEIQAFDLDTMVVTATRTLKQIQEVPSMVDVITAQDIQKKNIANVTDALQQLPSAFRDKSGAGGLQIRGFGSTEYLVLLDGQQVNNGYNGGMDWEMLPVENIERIEIAKGAASSIYGGHAVGAVINITTKDAKEKGAHGNAIVGYGSNKSWKKALYVNGKVNDKVSFGVGYENRKSDGFTGYYYTGSASKGTGVTPDKPIKQLSNGKYILGSRGKREYENENFTANIKYNFDENKSLKYTLTKAESTYAYPNPISFIKVGGVQQFAGSFDVGNGMVVKPSISSSILGYDGKKTSDIHTLSYNDDAAKLRVNAGYTNMKRNGYSSPSSPKTLPWYGAGTDSYYPSEVQSLDIEKAWENMGKHTVVAGANYKLEKFEQTRSYLTKWRDHNSIDTSKGKDGIYQRHAGKAQDIAIYLQDEYKFDDAWTMYLGARYDHYKKYDGRSIFWDTKGALTDDKKHNSGSYNEISPKLSFDFKADENTNIYASYGHSFNPPAMTQVYRYENGVHANPDLDPETSDTFEIGMKKKLSDKTSLGVALFHTKTDDKIVYTTHYKPGTTTTDYKDYENFGNEKRKGIELDLNHKFDKNWGAYLNYAWQRGTLSRAAVPGTNVLAQASAAVYGIPKHIFHAGVNYTNDKWGALLECQYVSARQASDDVTGEYGAEDPYCLFNAAINYKVFKGANLQFAIENIFDRQFYASEATCGRSYNVSLNYNF